MQFGVQLLNYDKLHTNITLESLSSEITAKHQRRFISNKNQIALLMLEKIARPHKMPNNHISLINDMHVSIPLLGADNEIKQQYNKLFATKYDKQPIHTQKRMLKLTSLEKIRQDIAKRRITRSSMTNVGRSRIHVLEDNSPSTSPVVVAKKTKGIKHDHFSCSCKETEFKEGGEPFVKCIKCRKPFHLKCFSNQIKDSSNFVCPVCFLKIS